MIDRSNLIRATLIGTALQVAMVVAGHYVPALAENWFAIGGTAISLVVGLIYALGARSSLGGGALGGALAGGVCAFIGIAVSVALGDVPAMTLAIGTAASAIGGAVGGIIGALIARKPGSATS
jgi:hypothetical protein